MAKLRTNVFKTTPTFSSALFPTSRHRVQMTQRLGNERPCPSAKSIVPYTAKHHHHHQKQQQQQLGVCSYISHHLPCRNKPRRRPPDVPTRLWTAQSTGVQCIAVQCVATPLEVQTSRRRRRLFRGYSRYNPDEMAREQKEKMQATRRKEAARPQHRIRKNARRLKMLWMVFVHPMQRLDEVNSLCAVQVLADTAAIHAVRVRLFSTRRCVLFTIRPEIPPTVDTAATNLLQQIEKLTVHFAIKLTRQVA